MTDSEKELWLCEFHDLYERGELEKADDMWLAAAPDVRVALCKVDPLLRMRLVDMLRKADGLPNWDWEVNE